MSILTGITNFLCRGDELPNEAITRLDKSDIEWSSKKNDDSGIFWGGIRIPKRSKAHYCVVGTTRSGKSTTLRLLMQDTLPDVLRKKNTRAVIYDPKHEMYSVLDGMGVGAATVILDPFDRRAFAWD